MNNPRMCEICAYQVQQWQTGAPIPYPICNHQTMTDTTLTSKASYNDLVTALREAREAMGCMDDRIHNEWGTGKYQPDEAIVKLDAMLTRITDEKAGEQR